MGYWNEGMNEPKDQDDRPDTSMRTGFPYQWDAEHVRSVDDETGAVTPTVRYLKVPLRVDGMAAYTASRKRPVEQKIDAVLSCYPKHVWDDDLSPYENWVSAAASEQVCGFGDVEAMVKMAGPGAAAFAHMLKPQSVSR